MDNQDNKDILNNTDSFGDAPVSDEKPEAQQSEKPAQQEPQEPPRPFGVSADLRPDSEEDVRKEGVDYGLRNEDYYDMDAIVARIAERKKAQKERKRKARIRFRLIVCGVLAFIGLLVFSFSDFFTVDNIVVEGNKYFTAEEVINMGHAAPGKNLLYQPDKGNITKYLEANPYIKNAKVKRRLPSTLVIQIEERKQAAAIKYADKYLLIDKEGLILRKTRTTPKITIIEGLVIKRMKVGQKILVKNETLLERALNILSLMNEHDLYFVRINVEDRYIKAYIFESLVCRGTYQQITDGISQNKLHTVIKELFKDGTKRGTITFSDEGYVSFEPAVY